MIITIDDIFSLSGGLDDVRLTARVRVSRPFGDDDWEAQVMGDVRVHDDIEGRDIPPAEWDSTEAEEIVCEAAIRAAKEDE